ncbi:MAG: EamA family transporter [Minisyncoccia bacterium]
MNLLLIGVIAVPFLFAVATLADKFLVHGDGDDSNPGAIQALGGVFSIIFIVPFGLYVYFSNRDLGDWNTFVCLMFIEGLQILSMYLYMTVLKDEGPSRVAPWWQTVPVYGAIAGIFFLTEIPSTIEWVGIILVVVGGIIVSFKKGHLSKKTVILMTLATLMIAIYEVGFANFGRDIDWVSALLISLLGKVFWGLMFLVGKKERRGFIIAIRTKFKIQSITETTCVVADLGLLYFILVLPVALVQSICCFQPLFVLGGAIYLSRYFPKVMQEETEGYTRIQKVVGTILVVIGGIILSIIMN